MEFLFRIFTAIRKRECSIERKRMELQSYFNNCKKSAISDVINRNIPEMLHPIKTQ